MRYHHQLSNKIHGISHIYAVQKVPFQNLCKFLHIGSLDYMIPMSQTHEPVRAIRFCSLTIRLH